jgi:signal transduction histidine kinase
MSAAADARVLVMAPVGRDAALTQQLLNQAGIDAIACRDVDHLLEELRAGAGAIVVTVETLARSVDERLSRALDDQPTWSDLPLVVLTSGGDATPSITRLMQTLGSHVNTTLLERPIRGVTLVHAVRAAIRARRRQYEVRDHLAEMERASRAKDEFLAMLAHELRNPLAAIRNAVVAAGLDPLRRERALEIARRSTDQLGRLIDDLLDVARITHGHITLRKEPTHLAAILERAVESVSPIVQDRGHHLTVSLCEEDARVDADPARIEQVVANLISNAAKYTEPFGRIEVALAREGNEVVICVRDSGIGIAPEMLPHVFDLFAQADRALDRSQGGLGIGLTIARRLVALHGGRIEARSRGLGHGTEIIVHLPALPQQRHAPPSVRPPPVPSRAARILVVEDNPDAAESLQMLLELQGHQVRTAPDAEAALQALQSERPDVMLVDIGLPGMNGYDLARVIRGDPSYCDVVLIALTGYGREEDRRAARDAGFDHHLVKPVSPERLEALVSGMAAAE